MDMNRALHIANGNLMIDEKIVSLPSPIGEVIPIGDLIIVRLEPPQGIIFNRNIFCFNSQGDLLWQIEASPHGTQKDKPFGSIFLNEHRDLIAANWIGVDYKVNIADGSIEPSRMSK